MKPRSKIEWPGSTVAKMRNTNDLDDERLRDTDNHNDERHL